MAKKSKTQRAKASAARQQRKAARRQEEELAAQKEASAAEGEGKKASAGKSVVKKDAAQASAEGKKKSPAKKADSGKPKKSRFQFFKDVRAEMRRVTWPTRMDVLRWTGVVVVALLFFGVFVAVLDNLIITPILVAISGI